MSKRPKDEILKEAKFLLRLNNPVFGGPYGGYAAERFVTVMSEMVELVEENSRD